MKMELTAGNTARDMVQQHMRAFAFTVRTNRLAGRDVVAAYVDALAGAVALTIAGRHGSKEDVVNVTILKLREAVERDLKHLKA